MKPSKVLAALAASAALAGGLAVSALPAHAAGLHIIQIVNTGAEPASPSTTVTVTCADDTVDVPHKETITLTGSGTVTAPAGCTPTNVSYMDIDGLYESAAIASAAATPVIVDNSTLTYLDDESWTGTVGALPTAGVLNADADFVWSIPMNWTYEQRHVDYFGGASAFGPATSTIIATPLVATADTAGTPPAQGVPGPVGFHLAADGTVTIVADQARVAGYVFNNSGCAVADSRWSVSYEWQPAGFVAPVDAFTEYANAGPVGGPSAGTYDGASFNAGAPADHVGETLAVKLSVIPYLAAVCSGGGAISGIVQVYAPHQTIEAAPPATGSVQTASPVCDDQSVLSGRMVEVRDAAGAVVKSGVAGDLLTDIPVGDYTAFVSDGEGGWLSGQPVTVADAGTATVAAQTDGSPTCIVVETTTTVAETTTTTVAPTTTGSDNGSGAGVTTTIPLDLPVTGGDTSGTLWIAAALAAAGAALAGATRRRRSSLSV